MIEVVLNQENYTKFVAEAKKRMYVKGWDIKDLATQIKRPVGSVRKFFSRKSKPSRFIAAEIAEVLDMKVRDWK